MSYYYPYYPYYRYPLSNAVPQSPTKSKEPSADRDWPLISLLRE